MIYKIGDNIISSLGFTTEENFNAVKQGVSGVKHYEAGVFDLPEAFMAALIDKKKLNDEFAKISSKDDYTDLEKAAILSVFTANKEVQIDLSNEKTIFILSTTKGNVDQLTMNNLMSDKNHYSLFPVNYSLYLWHTAELIADFFGNKNTPIVVSNACISGAAAQIAAMRELQSEKYDYAVVVGVDFLSKFIISGFQSFKALSPKLCRPFDKDRCGLNLGEAAATIIFSKETRSDTAASLVCGAIRNDSNHISAPSRTGEGSFRALKNILQDINVENIAFINAHGTATPYNDAAEMNAIVRAGLLHLPVNSLKSYFGHTLGATGVLETIISMRALSKKTVLKSLGFEQGEQLTIDNEQFTANACRENMTTDKKYFIKMMSGFGGVSAALLFSDMRQSDMRCETQKNLKSQVSNLFIKKHIKLSFKSSAEVVEFYRSLQLDYPKFFKMDGLSKLGVLASEIIFKDEKKRFEPTENIAVICFNRSSSLDIDTKYQATIQNNEDYFPSPSLFVYTLPNIVTGEIAIRNKFFGETSFYVCKEFDAKQIVGIVKNAFSDKTTTALLTAWIEHFEEKHEVMMMLVEREEGEVEFTEKQVQNIK
jgi:3-oxoacyl-[acyl-carrier-protein] synthase-1